MTRTFSLLNINSELGDKVVVLKHQCQILPWQGIIPLISVLQDRSYDGFVPSGTYTVTAIQHLSPDEGCSKVYTIEGPL